MTTIITPDNLIQYVYGECSETQIQAIEVLIDTDEAFRKQYHTLLIAKTKIDTVIDDPSSQTIQKILNFSREYDLHSV